MITLRSLAIALKGDVAGRQVLCPGPHHSARDRSLAVQPCDSTPDGFTVFSHAGDAWDVCRDYVREKLGMPRWEPKASAGGTSARYVYEDREGKPYLRVTRTPDTFTQTETATETVTETATVTATTPGTPGDGESLPFDGGVESPVVPPVAGY